MRDKFHRQMGQIQNRWHRVALKALEHCRVASRNLVEVREEEIRALIKADSEIVSETSAIQKGCLDLIALQQPMAIDLRVISSLLRSADDVERINRSCVHIAEVARAQLYDKSLPQFEKIKVLSKKVIAQLEDGIEAFQGRDVERARRVIEGDDEIDDLHSEIFGSLLERMKQGDARASLLMFVSRWMERIADRAVRLASRAIYIVEGRDAEYEAEIGEHKVFPNGNSEWANGT